MPHRLSAALIMPNSNGKYRLMCATSDQRDGATEISNSSRKYSWIAQIKPSAMPSTFR